VSAAAPRASHSPVRAREAGADSRTSPAHAFGNWSLRMLVLLMALAALALLLALASGLPTASATFPGLRSRAGSRGLSGSRIGLGRRADE